MAKNVNRKATKADKEKAIKHLQEIEKHQVKGNLSPKQLALVIDYVISRGNIKRKNKSEEQSEKAKARTYLRRPALLVDVLRATAPEIISLGTRVTRLRQRIVTLDEGYSVLAQTLHDHGYRDVDFKKASKQVEVRLKRGIKSRKKQHAEQLKKMAAQRTKTTTPSHSNVIKMHVNKPKKSHKKSTKKVTHKATKKSTKRSKSKKAKK